MKSIGPLVARGVDRGPTLWAVSITVVAVPGVLAFFLPVVADARFGDGEPAAWLENGLRVWLACLAAVAAIAVLGGYWLPRTAGASAPARARNRDEFAELGLLGTAWPVMVVMTIWLILSQDGDPRWLVWVTGASAVVGIAAQVHLLGAALAQTRRIRREHHANLAKKRTRP
ncbi:MAG TPA: hypothetical protein VM347_34560 [Nonomuraea sp.]|nr:hypothetical protein [Nonomuraea sp.]